MNLSTSCTSFIFSVERRYRNFCFGFIALNDLTSLQLIQKAFCVERHTFDIQRRSEVHFPPLECCKGDNTSTPEGYCLLCLFHISLTPEEYS